MLSIMKDEIYIVSTKVENFFKRKVPIIKKKKKKRVTVNLTLIHYSYLTPSLKWKAKKKKFLFCLIIYIVIYFAQSVTKHAVSEY